MRRNLWIRSTDAKDLVDTFLLLTVTTILVVRLFLVITGYPQLGGEGHRGLATADVELVHRGQIGGLEPIRILAGRPQRVQHRALEPAAGVVLRDSLLGGPIARHRLLPS